MPRIKKYVVLNSFERNDRRLIKLYARRAGMGYEEFAVYLKSLRDNPVTYEIKFETLPSKVYVKLEKVASKKRTHLLVFSDGKIRTSTGRYQEGKYFNSNENYGVTEDKIEKYFDKIFKDASLPLIVSGVNSISSRICHGLYRNREITKELLVSSLNNEKPEFLKFTLKELYDKNASYDYSSELPDVKKAIVNYIENRKEDIMTQGLENCSVLDSTVEEVVSKYLIFQKLDSAGE